MILGQEINKATLFKGGINFNILESGDIYTIQKDMIQINLLCGNNIEGSASNLYLRIFKKDKIEYTKMIGIDSPSSFYIENNKVYYKGTFNEVDYLVILTVLENIWFWEVNLTNLNKEATSVDVIYGQDVAIANVFSVKNNEAYTCQYIDHKVFKNELGYTVCSRQNQGTPHYLQQGSLTKNIAYSTDGFQFFGLDYKLTNLPKVLMENELENKNYQYEFAYTALQSDKVLLENNTKFVFYGLFEEEIVEVAENVRFEDKILKSYEEIIKDSYKVKDNGFSKLVRTMDLNNVLNSIPFTNEELDKYFPNKHHIEKDNNIILSFFNEDSSHIILKEKERLVERPHGNIAITGNNLFIKKEIISTTSFMFGVFNSHIVVGNSSFNKLSSNIRNPLNIAKLSGQRILIEIDGKYQLLGVPSVYELGVNYSKWYYKLNNDCIKITSMVLVDSPEIILDVKSERGKKYNFIILNHIVMGNNEYELPFELNVNDNNIEYIPNNNSMCYGKYPNFRYNMIILENNFIINDDSIFYDDKISRNQPLVTLSINESNSFRIITQGRINGEIYELKDYNLEEVKKDYLKYFKNNLNHFNLSINNEYKDEVDKFNDIAMWYTHNALIHYSSPHGLEQYSGAAWGTRDVCQGPIEYFLATQKYAVARDVILKIYSHQFKQNGDWPQWFMFDEYYKIQAHESHGDIIVWPLRTLASYLINTGDYSVLEEKVPYTDLDKTDYTEEYVSILDHVIHQIKAIENSFINGTHLSCYGGGDWDDTLQPANKTLTKNMVSGWTVALTYEAMNMFSIAIKEYNSNHSKNINNLANNIKEDYIKYIIKDNVPSGFLLFDNDSIKYMLHPSDNETGLNYRLLPFNRGIISEIFTKEQVDSYIELINQHLKHPDGVRLMNNTVKYKGGINTYFTRAETAANFGREIGLQYVHAHIRFIEAMAKLGKSNEVWKNLLVINPIKIQDVVPNALRRQSNTYFSSSDANFLDRYEAMKDFDKLRDGKIGVKGGWRIYSSGPGIYLNQLIANCLGIRVYNNNLVIDPVLPIYLNGLKFNYQFNGNDIEINYHISSNKNEISKIIINGNNVEFTTLDNKYRMGGAVINKVILDNSLNYKNVIDVYM